MDLVQQFETIKNRKPVSTHPPGSIRNVFQIYEKEGLDHLGNPITWIKLEPEEQKKKKSLT
tara:strand:+ start:925 stop:1107 length:183 start_codon:yes stop_codon:yes gene_type:complete